MPAPMTSPGMINTVPSRMAIRPSAGWRVECAGDGRAQRDVDQVVLMRGPVHRVDEDVAVRVRGEILIVGE